MDTTTAFAMGQISKDKELMVFDWNKAAQLIRGTKPKTASAGLQSDWEWTGGEIYANGKPIPKEETYTYLASTWAIPELKMDGEIMDCYIMKTEMPPEWGENPANVYWPVSALMIIGST
ncbi:MAG: hypothetical protein UY48_C0001G0059 [Candidatus Gottesmanbacteria bacterium GW2011_GWB1_49_7]|uniref:Uncharacterized protein n=1 Tax=Candidatus Gottesmanbacteria bacterium GW2011_GWB1_49_7 TaxID=1618448 RepID=A0A0G1W3Z4_9BACT|nr:MAG: hypothetical protein UY48_C0001G0059 [Candidatus Gottesmanbacteria bacterium GW2011_GWB1_49_7]